MGRRPQSLPERAKRRFTFDDSVRNSNDPALPRRTRSNSCRPEQVIEYVIVSLESGGITSPAFYLVLIVLVIGIALLRLPGLFLDLLQRASADLFGWILANSRVRFLFLLNAKYLWGRLPRCSGFRRTLGG